MSDSYVSVITEDLITCGTLLGPLTSETPDTLAVLTWRCTDDLPIAKQLLKVNAREGTSNWLSHILPARNPEEQTLEIIAKGGQLYFRTLRDVGAGEELRAWFGQQLADILKLPMIPPNVVEGEKRFECMLCQERFENPFPVVAHLMYRCRRKDHDLVGLYSTFKKKNSGGRVKNFNIATLTDMNDDDSSEEETKRKKKVDEEITTKKLRSSEEYENVRSTKSDELRLSSDSNTYNATVYPTVDLTTNDSTSAFKKVDKSSFHAPFPALLASDAFHNNNFSPFQYQLGTSSYSLESQLTSAFAPQHPAHKVMRKMSPESSYELVPPSMNDPRFYTPKSNKTFPLLPFLPPSLAALSFPTQNWCAKCNASFRMTSDLVYHMRSHHKRETDPQKLKREEKLRCHICNETFRERHHLTRHMTSHQ